MQALLLHIKVARQDRPVVADRGLRRSHFVDRPANVRCPNQQDGANDPQLPSGQILYWSPESESPPVTPWRVQVAPVLLTGAFLTVLD
jgi:hypothetical protein